MNILNFDDTKHVFLRCNTDFRLFMSGVMLRHYQPYNYHLDWHAVMSPEFPKNVRIMISSVTGNIFI